MISGITSIVVFVICLFWMKDLSSKLRDQLMVSAQDKALVEARARGISTEEVIAATHHPWRQIPKWDLVGSSFGISLFLLVYFAAAGFFTIFYSTVFVNPSGLNFTTAQSNHLNEWFWGADAVALIVVGLLSDCLKVRKPFMLVGAVGSIVMLLIFFHQTEPPPYRLLHPGVHGGGAGLLPVPLPTRRGWPATPRWSRRRTRPWWGPDWPCGDGSCAWWSGVSFIFLPVVITSVNPVVDNLPLASNPIPGDRPPTSRTSWPPIPSRWPSPRSTPPC